MKGKSGESYELRAEQFQAVEKTLNHYKNKISEKFLWNAKPRFGKILFCVRDIAKISAQSKCTLSCSIEKFLAVEYIASCHDLIQNSPFQANSLKLRDNLCSATTNNKSRSYSTRLSFDFLSLHYRKSTVKFLSNFFAKIFLPTLLAEFKIAVIIFFGV